MSIISVMAASISSLTSSMGTIMQDTFCESFDNTFIVPDELSGSIIVIKVTESKYFVSLVDMPTL